MSEEKRSMESLAAALWEGQMSLEVNRMAPLVHVLANEATDMN